MSWIIAGAGVLVVLVGVYLAQRRRRRPRTLVGRWAADNGFVNRTDSRVHLFVQGPPFDRGDGVVERALLVGQCARRPALIAYFGWYRGDPSRVDGACLALVLELPAEVAPLQLEAREEAEGERFEQLYRITCGGPELVAGVVTPAFMRVLVAGTALERVNLRLDGTAMIVWRDGELVGGRQLTALHDLAAELYRQIPESVLRGEQAPVATPATAPVSAPPGASAIDIHGRAGAAWQVGGSREEVWVALPVEAAWPRLDIVAYELLTDQYHATRFDRPAPSAHPLVDVMFAVRSGDENFRRDVLADLADWLPIDDRTRRCGLVLERDPQRSAATADRSMSRISAYAPGRLADTALVELLADVVHEVSQRLSERTYGYRVSGRRERSPQQV
ncbi:hypothetical protein [Actinophytocola xanthii]|uniref:Uncharacterized protein n=1 Tax=Actinophytocola xanthii TaxID=1912961 RepID=A0A1Q8C8V5_9PSEU|nr:hypothetical protein [Actinophytocola xanthii]OLF10763.1 hypothetical protein BU204_31175 [Actinophytocola xanthii]